MKDRQPKRVALAVMFACFSAVVATAPCYHQRCIETVCPGPLCRKNSAMHGNASSSQSSGRQPLTFVGHALRGHQHQSRRRRRHLHPTHAWGDAILSAIATKCASPSVAPLPLRSTRAFSSGSPTARAHSLAGNDDERTFPPESFSRFSKYLIKVGEVSGGGLISNGVDGPGQRTGNGRKEAIRWLDTLGDDCAGDPQQIGTPAASASPPHAPRPFSILSWNILAQSLYESQYQRRRIQQVAFASTQTPVPSLSSSPHPHPWSQRLKRIVQILSRSDADIVCLQEATARSFKHDLLPALWKHGYDGIAQEDDRAETPFPLKAASKHKNPRNHLVATFWKRDRFEPVGEALVRTRSLVTVLRLKGRGLEEEHGSAATPTLAVVNVHLEGHPKRFSERTHQLQHAMTDLSKTMEQETTGPSRTDDGTARIGKLNALVLAGDFNCELQSSACSTYLRVGSLGTQAGLGGIHGGDSLVVPPGLLETAEAAEVVQPILEWGRVLPEHKLAELSPHPFRMNFLSSAYPPWLGRDDARSHFTFCSELDKRPVPGLDQLWFANTLVRTGLRRMFNDCDTGLWERYFYDDAEVAQRRDDERKQVLASGLPSLDCTYPSDHLPIGAVFDWKRDARDRGDSVKGTEEGALKELIVVNADGNNVQDGAFRERLNQEQRKSRLQSFETPHEELDHLLHSCPYESQEQQADIRFVLSPLDPPMSLTTKERPTPDQFRQLAARRETKTVLLRTAALRVRPWLKNMWKVNKKVGKLDRHRAVEMAGLLERSEG